MCSCGAPLQGRQCVYVRAEDSSARMNACEQARAELCAGACAALL